MTERALERKDLISALTTSPHGDLRLYAAVAIPASQQDPEFYSKLISWNARTGQVRDAKVALPVLALANPDLPRAAVENALALLADLPPRMFLQALNFAKDLRNGWDYVPAQVADRTKASAKKGIPACAAMPIPVRHLLRRLGERYLRDLEADRRTWDRVALQHRATLRALYARLHVEAGGGRHSYEEQALFGPSKQTPDRERPTRGKFAVVRSLPNLSPVEIGGLITRHRIPFTVARGALGAKAKDVDVTLALIGAMTDTELVTNMRALKRLGVTSTPVLKAALEQRLEKAGGKKRVPKATLKTTRAAEALKADGDEVLSTKLAALQERQLDNMGSVEGRWLVIADKSGSMDVAIETANQVAAVLARMAKDVRLVYVDTEPRAVEATGKTYEELKAATALMTAAGATSLGCGLDYALQQKWEVDGIVLVTDGAENQSPRFADVYERYSKFVDKPVPVYWYHVLGDIRGMLRQVAAKQNVVPQEFHYRGAEQQRDAEIATFRMQCDRAKIVLDRFDLTSGVDYYGLPNLCASMRTNRYSLTDEIMATPLATLDAVLDKTRGIKVIAEEPVHA